MKFFTPQLYERCNSKDFNAAFAAATEWEDTIKKYVKTLTWLDTAPAGLKQMRKRFCGHDLQIVSQNRVGAETFILFAVGEGRAWMLSYRTLAAPIWTETDSTHECWDDGGQRLWLYDELGRISAGHYRHEILISDGSVLQIDFSDVQIKSTPIPRSEQRQRKLGLTMEFTVSGDSLLTGFRRGSLAVEHKAGARSRRKSTRTSSRRSTKTRQNAKGKP